MLCPLPLSISHVSCVGVCAAPFCACSLPPNSKQKKRKGRHLSITSIIGRRRRRSTVETVARSGGCLSGGEKGQKGRALWVFSARSTQQPIDMAAAHSKTTAIANSNKVKSPPWLVPKEKEKNTQMERAFCGVVSRGGAGMGRLDFRLLLARPRWKRAAPVEFHGSSTGGV